MNRRPSFQKKALMVASAICAFALALPTTSAHAQRSVYDTTDDMRRIPIPKVDRSNDPVIALKGGTVLDGNGGKAITGGVVVTQGDRILSVGTAGNVTIPQGAQIIDATGLYIMPGLIDLHIHFTQQRGSDLAYYSNDAASSAIRGTVLAKDLVEAGITAARDVGTGGNVALRIKEAVDRGIIKGPRVFWSGGLLASTGGHGDEITSTATGRPKNSSGGKSVADGPWAWRVLVREQIKAGADWIKISAPAQKEEIEAAIDEAHSHGIGVAIDSWGHYTDTAIMAGVDTLEHPLDMSDKAVSLMKRHGTAFVPTIGAFHNLFTTGYETAHIVPGGFYHTFSRRFAIDHQDHLKQITKAYKAGVPVGVGTDIPFENEVRYPDAYFLELGYLKEAGMSNEDVLASATRVGANILKIGDKLGTLEAGKIADIIVLGDDPRVDLAHLRNLHYVIADGKIAFEKVAR